MLMRRPTHENGTTELLVSDFDRTIETDGIESNWKGFCELSTPYELTGVRKQTKIDAIP